MRGIALAVRLFIDQGTGVASLDPLC